MNNQNKGTLILISAPSGGGKNAVIQALVKRFASSVQLVTTTSRPPRVGEKDGVDYHFLHREEFEKRLAAGAFVEHNEYAHNLYGTEWSVLNGCLEKYALIFSQAEVNGKKSLDKVKVPHISVFLLPENIGVLKKRLLNRGGMPDDDIAKRLKIAENEIEESKRYDLAIENTEGKMDETVAKIAEYICQNVPGAVELDTPPT